MLRQLPREARVVCVYRGDKLVIPDGASPLTADDEVVMIVHHDALDIVDKKWGVSNGQKIPDEEEK